MADLYSRLKHLQEQKARRPGAGTADPAAGPVGDHPAVRELAPGPGWRRIAPGVFERSDTLSLEVPLDWSRVSPLVGSVAGTRPFFLDVETSARSGGAGSLAFLIGVGQLVVGERGCDDCGEHATAVRVTQLFLSEPASEPAQLQRLAEIVGEPADACYVTYNGGSFDLPVLRTRHILNRMTFPDGRHWDLLHLTRRLYAPVIGSCTLGRVESRVLGRRREADVPGSEVPDRYQEFVRDGDVARIADVVAHHFYDIAHLAELAAVLNAHVSGTGRPGRIPPDQVALARFLVQRGGGDQYRRAAGLLDGVIAETAERLRGARAAARRSGLAGRLQRRVPQQWAVCRELRAVIARRRREWEVLLHLRRELWQERGSRHDAVEYAKVLEHRMGAYDEALAVIDACLEQPNEDGGTNRATPAPPGVTDERLEYRRQRLLRKRDQSTGRR